MLRSVVTTIQEPTAALKSLAAALGNVKDVLIVVGDRKGPSHFQLDGCNFLDLQQQLELPFALAKLLPIGHYSRKNLGYLQAIKLGASCLYETDDDNAPLESWCRRSLNVQALTIREQGWVNAYSWFTEDLIWPRGFPLDAIQSAQKHSPGNSLLSFTDSSPIGLEACQAPIQQGLANLSPDVDAVWRLVLDRPFHFKEAKSICLPPGAWCPFNSQSTWWWPVAYPLLYLPSHCSFRMTDIWRSFIAQRCLWELGNGVVFHSPEVVQERNPHNLMVDFEAEISGYLHNREFVKQLESLNLLPGEAEVGGNLRLCYQALVDLGLLPEDELVLIEAWLTDMNSLTPDMVP